MVTYMTYFDIHLSKNICYIWKSKPFRNFFGTTNLSCLKSIDFCWGYFSLLTFTYIFLSFFIEIFSTTFVLMMIAISSSCYSMIFSNIISEWCEWWSYDFISYTRWQNENLDVAASKSTAAMHSKLPFSSFLLLNFLLQISITPSQLEVSPILNPSLSFIYFSFVLI